jgi:hypothetical protein
MQDREWIAGDDPVAAPTLERVWAATRPPELSGDDFDRIWADVQRAYDERSAVLPMAVASSSRRVGWPGRALAWVPFGLANAAAILVAVSLMNGPRDDRPRVAELESVSVAPVAASPKFDLEPFETLVIQIDGNVVKDRRDKAVDESLSLALNDLPAVNQNDTLNHWEALSND